MVRLIENRKHKLRIPVVCAPSPNINTQCHAFVLKSQATSISSAWLCIKFTSVMVRTKGWIRQSIRTLCFSKPHSRSTKATRMDHSQRFEEERLPLYHADQFYPVHIGETFISRYKVVGKLGYGAYSTVWLCRDMRSRNPSRTILT